MRKRMHGLTLILFPPWLQKSTHLSQQTSFRYGNAMSFRRRLGFGHRQTSLPLCANSGSISAGVSSRSTWSLLHAFFHSLSLLCCMLQTHQNDTKRCSFFLFLFFTFGSFVFFSTRNNNQIGKLHLVVTRTLHFSLHATIHGKLHAIFFSLSRVHF